MPGVFISYRREDSAPYAGRLFDWISERIGKEQTFIDVNTIQAGDDFVDVLQENVGACQILLAVIGKLWLQCVDENGKRRLDDPEDYVRIEVAAALDRNVRVIPVLVDGARMPRTEELPELLAKLGRRQAIELSHARFAQDIVPIMQIVEKSLASRRETAPEEAAQGRWPGESKINPADKQCYVWIPPGTFTMGCSPGDKECFENEKPTRKVLIEKGLWLGQTPVTQAAYERVTHRNPSCFKGADRPVEQVSWDEAVAYCRAVGGRLPTEVEWEYAARAGSTGARYGEAIQIAWHGYDGDGGLETHPVGRKEPNAWGLYDMLGNVWEFTAGWYEEGRSRSLRGGSWFNNSRGSRASTRVSGQLDARSNFVGFRCVWVSP